MQPGSCTAGLQLPTTAPAILPVSRMCVSDGGHGRCCGASLWIAAVSSPHAHATAACPLLVNIITGFNQTSDSSNFFILNSLLCLKCSF